MTYERGYHPQVAVTCTIWRPYIKHPGVEGFGYNNTDALDSALKLLEKVESLEGKYKQIERDVKYDSLIVSFRYNENVITNIFNQSADGFIILDEPYELNKLSGVVTKVLEYSNLGVSCLNEGEEVYHWDDIGILSGTSGLAIVKDNMVIRTKMMSIS